LNVKTNHLQTKNKRKIAIVASSLSGGGAERVSAILSRILENLGFEVHVITVLSGVDFQFSGTYLDLGKYKAKKDNFIGRLERLMRFKKYLKKHKFYAIIDSRSRPTFLKEFLIKNLLYRNQNIIYWVHNYNTQTYIPKSKFLARLIYKTNTTFVTVSNAIKDKIETAYGFKNVTNIYNPVDSTFLKDKLSDTVEKPDKYILYFGRLVNKSKNISLLINAYKSSKLPENKIKLIILGKGKDKEELESLVNSFNLDKDVVFHGFTKTPAEYIRNARFTVLSSRYEGFPMVVLESLSLGTPVVSVDCNSGPKEIIKHKKNGLLVENFNAEALADAFNALSFDNTLYEFCKSNTKSSVKHLSEESIGKEWLEILINGK